MVLDVGSTGGGTARFAAEETEQRRRNPNQDRGSYYRPMVPLLRIKAEEIVDGKLVSSTQE